MAYHLMLGQKVVASLGADNTINYDMNKVRESITEIIAGQGGNSSFFTTARVIYRWDRNRKTNNDAVYNMWKANPLVQNRITQMNALMFGRGLSWVYDERTQMIVDRFWRTNRLKQKLDAIGTDTQLYGEVFIGLFPQPSGDVKVGLYEANQVDIDFAPDNTYDIIKYIVSYRDESTGQDEQFELMPIETYLNDIEYAQPISAGTVKRSGAMGLNGAAAMKGGKGVMIHVFFNNSTSEVYGTSDFKQVFDILPDYMNFVGDRLTIHQLYGSPSWDITIDTDDPDVITNRINELAGFTIGSNPVHNAKETWKPLSAFGSGSQMISDDEKTLRGLLAAGFGFPEHLIFNQTHHQGEFDNTFAVQKNAENRQERFGAAFSDMHKYVMAIAGDDPSAVDLGQITFPEINIMPEKAKAESYVLKVGAGICSRRTASTNLGYNWKLEEPRILEERKIFGAPEDSSDMAGALGGRFTTPNQTEEADDGSDDSAARSTDPTAGITTQVFGDRKTNN